MASKPCWKKKKNEGEHDDDNLDLESQGDRVLLYICCSGSYVYLHFMNLDNPVKI